MDKKRVGGQIAIKIKNKNATVKYFVPRQISDHERSEQAPDPTVRHPRQHVRVGRIRRERGRTRGHALRATILLRKQQENLAFTPRTYSGKSYNLLTLLSLLEFIPDY